MSRRKIEPNAHSGVTIGSRLRQAMVRAGLTQREVARRASIDEGTVSNVMSRAANPNWATIERLVNAIGTTWGELFEEAEMPLSTRDAALIHDFKDYLERVLQTEAKRKQQRRSAKQARSTVVDEVVELPSARIPEAVIRAGARRTYRVLSDSMIGIGIPEDSVIYARPTSNLDAADGEIAIVRLNATLFLKRVDCRGKQIVLTSENRRYDDIHVGSGDRCELVAIVIL
jgi:SOS-response transcriptional repressor LexA